MMTPAIELRGLTKDYGSGTNRLRALDAVDLIVEPGQIFGFLGPNGAGKTTAIRILLDLLRPTAGAARVLGFDCQRDSIAVRRRCGYLPGELRLYEGMRGDEFLDFIDSFRPAQHDPRYRSELIERLGVNVAQPIRSLSKGNKQKLGLIQALMHRPELLILDEPTSGLDPLVQQTVAALLEDIARDGRTVFFSSHILPEVERLSHQVAIIRAGTIAAVENVGRLKGRSVHIIEVTFAHEPPATAFAGLAGVTELHRDGPLLRFQAQDGGIDALLKRIAAFTVLDLRTEQQSLEDTFLALYSGREATTHAPEPTEDRRAAS
jgi:ABC-2 type transport system ATP-binding protein